ncbi:hypothetical protein D3C85_1528570 [compost metagenome]
MQVQADPGLGEEAPGQLDSLNHRPRVGPADSVREVDLVESDLLVLQRCHVGQHFLEPNHGNRALEVAAESGQHIGLVH